MDEPAECIECGFMGEAEVFRTHLPGEYECPACQSQNNIRFYMPKEDRD